MNIYLNQFISKQFRKPGKVLDLGAGDFFDVACLKQLGWKADGVDLKTGTNLEKLFLSKKRPYDLVYSNYVLHKLNKPAVLIQTAYENLKPNGLLFLHTFDKTDKNSKSTLDKKQLADMCKKQGFINFKVKVFKFYDNDLEHKHWHKILEVIAQKPKDLFRA